MHRPLQLNCGNTSTLSRFRSLGTKMGEEENKGGADRQTDRQTHSTCLSLSSITSHFSFGKQQTFHRNTLRKPKNQAPVCLNHFPPLAPPFLKQHKSPQRIALIQGHSIQQPSKIILIPRRLVAESLSNFSSTWVRLPPQFTHISISLKHQGPSQTQVSAEDSTNTNTAS
jgi:hypothetical protein